MQDLDRPLHHWKDKDRAAACCPGLNVTLGRGLYATHLEGWGVAIVTFKLTGKWQARARIVTRRLGRPPNRYRMSRTTLDVGRRLTVGNFSSLVSSASYCGSVVTAVRDFMWTIL